MPRRDLAPGEWAVLALVAEGPTHGFAVARLLEPEGEVGRIWALRRPLVYRALETLETEALIRTDGTEPGDRGPRRRRVDITAEGTGRLAEWLVEPVRHVRDGRSQLLLKLLFLDRAGRDPAALVQAQSARFAEQLAAMERRRGELEGFDRVALDWRVQTTRAALAFLGEQAVEAVGDVVGEARPRELGQRARVEHDK